MISFKIMVNRIIAVALLVALLSGCTENDEQKINVYKHIDYDNYELFKEIVDQKDVKNVREIVKSADWENAKVEMVREADFQFGFSFINSNNEAKSPLYSLWISANGDLVEIVEEDYKYAQLNQEDSNILFEILTGTTLDKK